MESLLGYPHCSLHWRCALDTQSSAEKQASSHMELFAGSKLELTHLEHWGYVLRAVSSKNQGLWILLPEELCLFNKANCIMDIFYNIF